MENSSLSRISSLLWRIFDILRESVFTVARGPVVGTLGTIVGGGVAVRLWGPRSELEYSTWSNSLITGIYHAASARRHVLTFRPYQHVIIITMPYLEQFIANYTTHIYLDIYVWFNCCPMCFTCLQVKICDCPSHWCFCAYRTYHLIVSYNVRWMRLRSQKKK